MIPKALQAYTLIEYLWDNYRDVIELYIPIIVKHIIEDNLNSIDELKLKEFFVESYGLDNITFGGLRQILKRMRTKGLLIGHSSLYQINCKKVRLFVRDMPQEPDISDKMAEIKNALRILANQEYKLNLTEIEIEKGLLDFFQRNDGDIFFESDSLKVNKRNKSRSTTNQKIKYIISKYILDVKEKNPDVYDTLVRFAKGHMLVSLVSLQDFASYNGNLDNLYIYIDSPILYHLLGISNEGSCRLSTEMIERLHKLGAKLRIRDLHYNEFIHSMNCAIEFLDKEFPDMRYANGAARFALKNNLSPNDLTVKLQQLDGLMKKHDIITVPEQEAPTNYQDISNINLTNAISDIYTENGEFDLKSHREESIKRDVKTIIDIFRLRGNGSHTSLKTCNAILITLNRGIAKAAKEIGNKRVTSPIPPCLTNEMLSTILWANYPENNSNLNEELLVYECYRNIEIKNSILYRFYRDIKDKYNAHAITEEQYLATATSRLVIQMLKDETFNSEDLYTDTTAVEIAERIRQKTETRLSKAEANNSTIKANCRMRSIRNAKFIVNGIVFFLFSSAIVVRFVSFGESLALNILLALLIILFAVWGLCSWNGWIPSKNKVILILADYLFERNWNQLTKDCMAENRQTYN